MTEINVIIIGDNQATHEILANYLRLNASFGVVQFDDVDDALRGISLLPERVTAVLLDFIDPEIWVNKILGQIKEKYPHLPVITFSDKEQTDDQGYEIYQTMPRPVTQVEMSTLTKEISRLDTASRLQQQLSALKQLSEIGSLLTSEVTEDLGTLLNQAANLVCSLTGADCAVIYPYDPVGEQFYVLGAIGAHGLTIRKELNHRPRISGFAAMVRKAGQIVVSSVQDGEIQVGLNSAEETISLPSYQDVLQVVKGSKFIDRENVQSFVGVSLVMGAREEKPQSAHREVGVLYINFRKMHDFSDEELQIIHIFSHQVANAIHNARQLERGRQTELLRVASETISAEVDLLKMGEAVLDQLHKVVDYQKGSIQLISKGETRELIARQGFSAEQEQAQLLRPIPEDALIARIIANKKPGVLNNPESDPDWDTKYSPEIKAWIGIPLIYGNEAIGLITLDHNLAGHFANVDIDLLALFANQVAIAVRNARLLTESKWRIRDLVITNKIVEAISNKLDREDLFQTIVNEIAEQFECDQCTLFLWSEKAEALEAKVSHRERVDRAFKAGEGIAGLVYQFEQSIIVNDTTQDTRFIQIPSRADRGIRSILTVPMKIGDRVIGVLSADKDSTDWFTDNDQQLLENLITQIGYAIQQTETLDLIEEIGTLIAVEKGLDEVLKKIVQGAVDLVNVTSGVIHLLTEDRQTISQSVSYPTTFQHPSPRLSDKQGLTYQLVQSGNLIVVHRDEAESKFHPNLPQNIQLMIGVPLKIEEKVTGVLFLNDEDPHNFTETERSLLLTLANQAAIAIENTRYVTELDKRTTRLRQLQQVTTKITSETFNLETVLEVIVEGLSEIYQGVYGAIRLFDSSKNEFVHRVDIGALKGKIEYPPRPTGSSRYVIKTTEPLYAQPATTLPEGQTVIRPETVKAGVRAIALLPLLVKGKPIGILYIYLGTDYQFSQNDKEFLPLFANQVAMEINNARLFEETERRANDLAIANEVLSAISTEPDRNELFRKIVKQVAEKLNSDQCTLFVWSPQKNKLVPEVAYGLEMKREFSPGEGVAGWVYQHGQSALIDDNSQDKRYLYLSEANRPIKRSMVVVPVKMGDKIIGVISVDKDQPGWFDKNHQQLLETLMSQAGYAIQQAKGLEIFEEIAGLTTSQKNVEAVLARIVERAVELLNVTNGVIHLISEDGQHLEKSVPYPADFNHPGSRFEKQKGLTYKIYRNGKRIIVNKAQRDPRVNRALETAIKSIIGVPLKYEEKVIGVLFLNDNAPHQYSEGELALFSTLADQAAIALESARIIRRWQEELTRTKAISELGAELARLEQAI